MSLPRLCALTDRSLAGGSTHDAVVRALLEAGARWIQVREKTLAPGALLRQARAAVDAARALEGTSGALLVVNDRVDIAMAAGADGVHVGRDDLPPEEARRLLGPERIVGVSVHTVEEGIAAARLPVDYVAIGPVFPTASKPDAEPVVGLEAVSRLARSVALPVVAIGGIGPENARSVLEAGAAAVAVVSALYRGSSIADNVARLLAVL